jgi:tetratricopeptide (TPR) repeat protein
MQRFLSAIANNAVRIFSRSRANGAATTLKAEAIDVGEKHSHWATVGVCIFLVATTWFVFGQTLGHDFTNYDDNTYVYQNPKVTAGLTFAGLSWAFTHVHAQNWHPLTTISHMLDCSLYGLTPRGHHFTNVLLHTVAVLVLFFVLRQMTGAFWRSAFVAALFAIHPLRVESVAWIAERKDVLSGLFFMFTLGAYTRYARNPSIGRYIMMSILLVCGLMSKPMLVTTPLVLLLLDWWPLGRFAGPNLRGPESRRRSSLDRQLNVNRVILEKVPLLILSSASAIITFLAQRQAIGLPAELPITWRINNAIMSYMLYVWQMFWPVKLAVFYPHPENQLPTWEIIFAAVFVAAITITAIILRKKRPYVMTGWLWYLGMLAPVIGIVQVGWQARADRYTYLPHIGLYIALTWTVAESAGNRRTRKVVAALAVAIVTALSWIARTQASYWRNSETLWRHALMVTGDNDVAQNNVGIVLWAQGKLEEAISHFRSALKIRSQNAPAQDNLAKALLEKGEVAEALLHARKLVELQPENLEGRNIVGTILFQEGRAKDAVAEWEGVLAIEADNGNAASNLAWVYATYPSESMRNGERAVELAERALRLSGAKNPLIFRTLAAAYAESGRFEPAIATTERGRELAIAQGNTALAGEFDRNIVLYRAGSPLRDLSATNVQPRQ